MPLIPFVYPKLRNVLKPCDQRRRQIDAGGETSAKWANIGT